eukprot:g884.t1
MSYQGTDIKYTIAVLGVEPKILRTYNELLESPRIRTKPFDCFTKAQKFLQSRDGQNLIDGGTADISAVFLCLLSTEASPASDINSFVRLPGIVQKGKLIEKQEEQEEGEKKEKEVIEDSADTNSSNISRSNTIGTTISPITKSVSSPSLLMSHHSQKTVDRAVKVNRPFVLVLDKELDECPRDTQKFVQGCLEYGAYGTLALPLDDRNLAQMRVIRFLDRMSKVRKTYFNVLQALNPLQKNEKQIRGAAERRKMHLELRKKMLKRGEGIEDGEDRAKKLKPHMWKFDAGAHTTSDVSKGKKLSSRLKNLMKKNKFAKFHQRKAKGKRHKSTQLGGIVAALSTVAKQGDLNMTEAAKKLRHKKYAAEMARGETVGQSSATAINLVDTSNIEALALDQDIDFEVKNHKGEKMHTDYTVRVDPIKLRERVLDKDPQYTLETQNEHPYNLLALPLKPITHGAVNPKVHIFIKKGEERYRKDNFTGALEMFDAAVKKDRYCMLGWHNKGLAHVKMGEFKAAKSSFGMALNLDQNNCTVLLNRGLVSFLLNQFDEALKDINYAVEIEPDNLDLIAMKGLINRRKGSFDVSRGDYLRYQRLKRVRAAAKVDEEKNSNSSKSRDGKNKQQDGNSPKGVKKSDGLEDDGASNSPLHSKGKLTTLAEYKKAMNLTDDVHAGLFGHQIPQAVKILMTKNPSERTDIDVLSIVELLHKYSFFPHLKEKVKFSFAKNILYETVEKGIRVLQEGEKASAFFILYSGRVSVKRFNLDVGTDQTVNIFHEDEIFGEESLHENKDCNVSVDTIRPCELFVLQKKDFLSLGAGDQILAEKSKRIKILEETGLFHGVGWTPEDRRALAAVSRIKIYPRGGVIISQGQFQGMLYFLISGVCRIVQQNDAVAELRRKENELKREIELFEMNFCHHHSLVGEKMIDVNHRMKEMEEQLVDVREKLTRAVAKVKAEQRGSSPKSARLKLPKGGGAVKEVTLTKLIPPALFGETAITDPYFGIEPASIIAETRVEVLCLRVKVLPSEKITEDFIKSVRLRATRYCKSKEILTRRGEELKWDAFRKNLMLRIPKGRWPLAKGKMIRKLGSGMEDII